MGEEEAKGELEGDGRVVIRLHGHSQVLSDSQLGCSQHDQLRQNILISLTGEGGLFRVKIPVWILWCFP